jgi:hypothetical protein
MINFNYENEFNLENEDYLFRLSSILSEGKKEGEIIISFVMTNIYTKSILNI